LQNRAKPSSLKKQFLQQLSLTLITRATITLKTRWSRFASSLRTAAIAFALLPALGISGCDRHSSTARTPSGPEAAVATTVYQGEGVVKGLDVKRPSIEIDHQEIKGLMPAMTMEFYVKDKSLLAGLKPGDHIQFTLENGVGGLKITSIKRL